MMANDQTKPLKKETNYFNSHKQELLKTYANQFVLIKDEDLIGSFTSANDAYKVGVEKYGNEPFLIKQVLDLDKLKTYQRYENSST